MPPRVRHPKLQPPPLLPWGPSHTCQCICQRRSRNFSSTPQNATRQRGDMYRWLNGPGEVFRQPLRGSTNYLNAYDRSGNLLRAKDASVGAKSKIKEAEEDQDNEKVEEQEEGDERANRERRNASISGAISQAKKDIPVLPKETAEDLMPFPMNRQFRSQAVLSEELKDAIWRRVIVDGKSVRDTSAVLNVEMRRVAAVVRLKAVEKEWEEQGKPLATPYARAVQSMLPQTPYIPNDPVTHESINDLPVHRATELQIFHPVSESRHFTRRDAGKVFDRTLLPAEDRIPHPELIQLEKWKYEGVTKPERLERQRAANELEVNKRKEADRLRKAKEAQEVTRAVTGRSVFRFQDIKVESVGSDGRSRKGVGARYGVPHQDRKIGQVQIPTRVE